MAQNQGNSFTKSSPISLGTNLTSLAVSRNKELMGDLETRNGFVPLSQKPAGAESLPAAGGALETAGGLSKKKN